VVNKEQTAHLIAIPFNHEGGGPLRLLCPCGLS